MTSFFDVLNDSFSLLAKEPKLFIPKLAVAALFSIPLLIFPELALEALSLKADLNAVMNTLFALAAFVIVSSLVDILVNSMYPFMVRDYFEKKPVSISNAFLESLGKFFVVAPAVLAVELLTILLAVIASFPLGIAILTGNIGIIALVVLATLAVFFIVLVLFYLIYPVSTLEKNHFIGALMQSASLSMKNKSDITKATAITFLISIVAFILAFAVNIYMKTGNIEGSILALLLFIGVRFATAMLYTYQFVLNPVFYLEYEKNKVLK